jgi:RNA recognition motif-containing protein
MLGKRGSVMLFLRGLPLEVTRKEIKAFVQGAIRGSDRRSFALKAAVCNCSILRITDPATGDSQLHGLVEVQPARAAMLAIEELNGKPLNGVRVEVRRYHHRSPLRDRRKAPPAAGTSDNRQGERRRRNLKIELVNA